MFCFRDLNLGLQISLIILYNGLKKGFNNLILKVAVLARNLIMLKNNVLFS